MYLNQKPSNFSLNLRGKLLSLEEPKVMGILNLTPDSFYDGDAELSVDKVLEKCQNMVDSGVDIIDIGAMSTRPNSDELTAEIEIKRLEKYLTHIVASFPDIPLSLDTYRSEVALYGLEQGVHIINDISGGNLDPKIWEVVASYPAPYIAMHILGTPQTMQDAPDYDNVCTEVYKALTEKKEKAYKYNIKDIILDPGFGFGKTVVHNYSLLKHLDYFQNLNCPILVGLSRKSMLYKPIKSSPDQVLHLTSALHLDALKNGANILRVHDVREARETITIYQQYRDAP
jgi:dihydropteroate synthase